MLTSYPTRVVAIAVAALITSAAVAHAQDGSAGSPQVNTVRLELAQAGTVPPAARQAEQDVETAVRRFGIGVDGGIALDPELIMFGAHARFGPIFNRSIELRPGVEIGIGEITTLLGINVDVVYMLPGASRQSRWMPYVGAGPTFGLSHRGFSTDDDDNVDLGGVIDVDPDRNRFDFGDTDFNGGMNFFAGARNQRGLSFELKATAWGVSNIRMLVGFNFRPRRQPFSGLDRLCALSV